MEKVGGEGIMGNGSGFRVRAERNEKTRECSMCLFYSQVIEVMDVKG